MGLIKQQFAHTLQFWRRRVKYRCHQFRSRLGREYWVNGIVEIPVVFDQEFIRNQRQVAARGFS